MACTHGYHVFRRLIKFAIYIPPPGDFTNFTTTLVEVRPGTDNHACPAPEESFNDAEGLRRSELPLTYGHIQSALYDLITPMISSRKARARRVSTEFHQVLVNIDLFIRMHREPLEKVDWQPKIIDPLPMFSSAATRVTPPGKNLGGNICAYMMDRRSRCDYVQIEIVLKRNIDWVSSLPQRKKHLHYRSI